MAEKNKSFPPFFFRNDLRCRKNDHHVRILSERFIILHTDKAVFAFFGLAVFRRGLVDQRAGRGIIFKVPIARQVKTSVLSLLDGIGSTERTAEIASQEFSG